MLGNLIDQQITAIYDWPFGATIATVLVAIVVSVNLVSMRLLDRGRPCQQHDLARHGLGARPCFIR